MESVADRIAGAVRRKASAAAAPKKEKAGPEEGRAEESPRENAPGGAGSKAAALGKVGRSVKDRAAGPELSSTQDWCPVEDIVYGMAKMKDWAGGGYVMVLEVKPINFLNESFEERAGNIEAFYEWLKIAPVNLQFHMTTTTSDTSGLIDSVMRRSEDETNPATLRRRDAYVEKIRTLTRSGSESRRFYVSFRYEGDEDGGVSTDPEEIAESMYQTAASIRYYFGRIGNRIVEHDDENMFLAQLLYNEMNPRSFLDDPFGSRMGRILSDYQALAVTRGLPFSAESVPMQDYIAPRGIDDSGANFTVRDGMFIATMYVKSNGYNSDVCSGWMEDLCQFGNDVTVNIYAKKLPREQSIEAAGRTMRVKRSQANDDSTNDDHAEEYASGSINAKIVRDRMVNAGEDLYDVCILITIKETSRSELEKRRSRIRKALRAREIYVEDCWYRGREADLMQLPLMIRDSHIMGKARRNMLTSSLASTYFFTAFEVYEEDGFLIGINGNNSSLAAPDFFNTGIYKNGNIVVTGTSGMGKTYLLQQLGYALRVSGVRVYYILPYKGFEYFGACREIGGEYVNLAPGSKSCVNVMAIRPQSDADSSLIDDEGLTAETLLSKKVHQIVTFIQLLKPKEEMTDNEETQLNIVLAQLYGRFGITDDDESIWLDRKKRMLKAMPVLGDLYDACMEDGILSERVAVALRPFVEGICTNMNAQTNVDLDNKYLIFDVSNAGKQYLAAYVFIAVDCAYDGIKADRTQQSALIMDEVWKMMVNVYSAEYVMEIFKIIRGYGGLAIAATQDISDFLEFEGGTYGKKIISTSKIKFALGAEKVELEQLQDVLGLSDDDVRQMERFERGQAVMIANGDRVPIFVKGTDEETAIFTTDPATLRKLRAERKAEAAAIHRNGAEETENNGNSGESEEE